MRRPLVIELFAGTGSWSRGWLELGGRAVLFDIDHQPYHGPIPSGTELVLQDVRTLDGRQFKDADLILASPPCQEFSYMAMPWTRAKEIRRALQHQGEFPEGHAGSRTIAELTALFDACFRIQREASAAAGRHIPMVVENVKGAQPWVGRARWHHGSYYLWGDVPALMPTTIPRAKRAMDDIKNGHRKLANAHLPVGSGPLGRVARGDDGTKVGMPIDGTKVGGQWFGSTTSNAASPMRRVSSGSRARKAASARIAMIPEALSRHIASCYWPRTAQGVAP